LRIEKIENKKPIITKVGANLILLKLYISGLNSDGLFDPPPDIKKNPINNIKIDINSKL
tara:strand:+ start:289 stop:465 length:177 start_codon:yes stop_codon:yes gene_type:complete